MKKITMSVAALAIAMNSFGQCAKYKIIHGETNEVKTLTKIEWVKFENEIDGFTKFIDNSLCNHELFEVTSTAEDMIEWIEWDVENGRIYKEYAELYIENLREIIARTTKLRRNN